jgi:cell division protein FtsB
MTMRPLNSASRRRPSRRLPLRLVPVLILAAMALFTTFGDRGLVRLVALARDLAALGAATDRLAEENRRLAAEAERLRESPRALEAEARRELGLVGPDELVFEFPE